VYGQTKYAGSRLDNAMNQLSSAVRRGDQKAATEACTEVVEQLKRQAQLARDLAAKCTEPTLKKQLQGMVLHHCRLTFLRILCKMESENDTKFENRSAEKLDIILRP
jgi:hypothetical protein